MALYPPQYAKDPATGELRGWTIELARALAARIEVEFLPVEYSTPPQSLNEEAKGSGLVQSAITHSGWGGVHVAPPGYPAVQK